MRKIVFIILLMMVLSGCVKQPHALNHYQDLDELLMKRQEGKYDQAIAYDLRQGDACYNGHIKGFTCIFYNDDDFTLDQVYNNIAYVYAKSALILLICEDGSKSMLLAQRLADSGYRRVYYFVGGYQKYCQDNPNFIPEVGCNC